MAATVDEDDGREVVVGGTELMERVGIDRVLDARRYVLSILSTSSVSLMKAADKPATRSTLRKRI